MKKIASAVLACTMAASLAGCTITSPETVGSIGDTTFSAGSYLLAQYSAVNQLMDLVDDSSATVKQALKTDVTTDEGETMPGSEFVAQKTLENLEYSAGLDAALTARSIQLTDDQLSQIDSLTQQTMQNYGDLYAENGIGEKTVREAYRRNLAYTTLFSAVYGDDGEQPISDSDKTAWLNENAVAGDVLVLPLTNTDDTDHEVTDDDKDAVKALAQEAADKVNGGEALDELADDTLSAAFKVVGMDYDSESDLAANRNSVVIMPSELSYYGSDFENAVKDLEVGKTAVIERGNTLWVFSRRPASEVKDLSELKANYDLARLIKGEAFTQELTDAGAAMENHLDQSAMNAYKAGKVKLSK